MYICMIVFTPYTPYFRIYGQPLDAANPETKTELALNRIQAVSSDSKPIKNYDELVARGLIHEDPEDTVYDEYRVPDVVEAVARGNRIYNENPKLAELLVEEYVTMPRTFRK